MLLLIYIKHVEATCNTTMYFRGNTSSVMIERYHVHQNEAALELYSRGRPAPTLSRWHLNSASNNIQCYDPRTRGFHSSISLTRITTHIGALVHRLETVRRGNLPPIPGVTPCLPRQVDVRFWIRASSLSEADDWVVGPGHVAVHSFLVEDLITYVTRDYQRTTCSYIMVFICGLYL